MKETTELFLHIRNYDLKKKTISKTATNSKIFQISRASKAQRSISRNYVTADTYGDQPVPHDDSCFHLTGSKIRATWHAARMRQSVRRALE